MAQALPLPTIPEGTDDDSYGDGMDMDTLLDEMGLGDDDVPATPPRLLHSYTQGAAASPKPGLSSAMPSRGSPPKSPALQPSNRRSSPPHPVLHVRTRLGSSKVLSCWYL